MEKKSKINIVDKILMLIMAISADVADAAATAGIPLPFIGPVLPAISWFYGLVISAILIFWIIMKGTNVRWLLGGSGLELMPIINALPGRTAGIIATIIEDALPEKMGAAASDTKDKPKIHTNF